MLHTSKIKQNRVERGSANICKWQRIVFPKLIPSVIMHFSADGMFEEALER
jgi:hypothetical protein